MFAVGWTNDEGRLPSFSGTNACLQNSFLSFSRRWSRNTQYYTSPLNLCTHIGVEGQFQKPRITDRCSSKCGSPESSKRVAEVDWRADEAANMERRVRRQMQQKRRHGQKKRGLQSRRTAVRCGATKIENHRKRLRLRTKKVHKKRKHTKKSYTMTAPCAWIYGEMTPVLGLADLPLPLGSAVHVHLRP